jgi:hypothetical protein
MTPKCRKTDRSTNGSFSRSAKGYGCGRYKGHAELHPTNVLAGLALSKSGHEVGSTCHTIIATMSLEEGFSISRLLQRCGMEVGRDPWKAENVIYERVAAVESRRPGGIQIYLN